MRAVLVFCEGRHDVVFVKRSLVAVAGGKPFEKKVRDLPAPFGSSGAGPGFIRQLYAKRDLEDRQLAAAAHARPPTFEAVVTLPGDGTLCLLIGCGGDSKAPGNVDVVKKVATLVTTYQEPSGVDEVAFAFVFDADDAGLQARERSFASAYAECLGGQSTGHAGWARGELGPVGLFVFHDPSTLEGTLEDALAPMVCEAWSERWYAAGDYLSAHAHEADPIRKASKYKKAQISVTGQFLCPGDPMAKVIDSERLPRETFTGPVSQALVDFLRAVPW